MATHLRAHLWLEWRFARLQTRMSQGSGVCVCVCVCVCVYVCVCVCVCVCVHIYAHLYGCIYSLSLSLSLSCSSLSLFRSRALSLSRARALSLPPPPSLSIAQARAWRACECTYELCRHKFSKVLPIVAFELCMQNARSRTFLHGNATSRTEILRFFFSSAHAAGHVPLE